MVSRSGAYCTFWPAIDLSCRRSGEVDSLAGFGSQRFQLRKPVWMGKFIVCRGRMESDKPADAVLWRKAHGVHSSWAGKVLSPRCGWERYRHLALWQPRGRKTLYQPRTPACDRLPVG